ncbi:hypothetical protein D3C76_143100 [compost metagenome]
MARPTLFCGFGLEGGTGKVCVRSKGLWPAVQNMDRTRYRQELNRETFLQSAGYRVVSIPYDDLEGSPQLTTSLIRSLVAPFINGKNTVEQFTRLEREMIRLAVSRDGMIRPVDLVISRNAVVEARAAAPSPGVSGPGAVPRPNL